MVEGTTAERRRTRAVVPAGDGAGEQGVDVVACRAPVRGAWLLDCTRA